MVLGFFVGSDLLLHVIKRSFQGVNILELICLNAYPEPYGADTTGRNPSRKAGKTTGFLSLCQAQNFSDLIGARFIVTNGKKC
mgnify:CR=1 FL=1